MKREGTTAELAAERAINRELLEALKYARDKLLSERITAVRRLGSSPEWLAEQCGRDPVLAPINAAIAKAEGSSDPHSTDSATRLRNYASNARIVMEMDNANDRAVAAEFLCRDLAREL